MWISRNLKSSGSICLDVINQTWTPIYELIHIFETFLPQLLSYPNPKDPLNVEAANLLNLNKEEYEKNVRLLVKKHAQTQEHPIEIEEVKYREHKVSTDYEDLLSDELSDQEELSELSSTSGLFYEDDLFA